MLRTVVLGSLRHRGVVAALSAALVLYGLWSAVHAPLDVLPEFSPPQAVIQTEAPGFAPEQVEALVTQPIEAAVGGLAGMEALRSESIQGLSVVTAVFREDVDVLAARQLLAEGVGESAARLPLGVGPPRLSPLTSATMDVLKVGLVSDTRSAMELRALTEWTLRPRLLMVPGVARVNVFGGAVPQLQVQVRPEALIASGLALSEVVAAARDAVVVGGAGFVETANQRITLASLGEPASARELGKTVIAARDGAPLRLADLATVTEAPAPRFGDALVQGRPGVLLTLSSQWGANTMEVTRGLEAALRELAPLFQREGVTLYPRLHRPASFIESSLGNVQRALALGGVLVVGVLALFLRDPRTAFVSLTAIPLSLLTAVIVLRHSGATLNTMTLGGLAIAIGEVVDDAVVDVENIARRLRENAALGAPRAPLAVVLEASLEVRSAIVFATASVVLVFLPLLTLGGLAGSFFAPLAQSYLLAIVASLGIALTATPALCLLLLGRGPAHPSEPGLQTRLKHAYGALLERVLARPMSLLATGTAATVAALLLLPTLGGEFLPDFRERHLVLQLASAPGTALDETLRVGRRLSQALLALPGVATVEQQVGRAEQGEDTWGPERSEFHVELVPSGAADEERTVESVRALLDGVPGLRSEVLTFLGDRIRESISGESSEVVVHLFGDDLDALDRAARQVASALGELQGAADVQVPAGGNAPRVAIRPLPEALARFGFRPAEVLGPLETVYRGTTVAQLHRGNQVTDVVVIAPVESRDDVATIAALPVRNASGLRLPLGVLAQVREEEGRDVILHEGGRRRQTVTCNVAGRDLASFVAEARRAVAERVALPAGVYPVFAGTAEARAQAGRELLVRSAFGAAGIGLLLGMVSRHPRNLAVLATNLPLALVGGVLAVAVVAAFGGGGLSLGSLVGFVTLFGITSRNAIMMLSHYRHLVEVDGAAWGRETALRGAVERVVPVTMTALVTALGLLPVALSSGRPGGEIDGPMAVVILGGLASSTALTLLALPVLWLRYGRFEPRARE
jgi:CzcA family heavy metal efflux pump